MRDIILITVSSIKNNLKSKALTVVFVCVTLMIVAGLALFFCLLLIFWAADFGFYRLLTKENIVLSSKGD